MKTSRVRTLVQAVLALGVLAGGVALALHLIETQPEARRRPPARLARLVEVVPVAPTTEAVVIGAAGTVVAATEIELFPRVSGEVLEISPHLLPGGRVAAGEPLVRIDAADYTLAERQARSALARAQAELRLEQGNQRVAQAERALVGAEGDEALMLRKPQLAASMAAVEAARSLADRARLDTERTELKAPFNAVVRTRSVAVGSRVGPSTPLATLVGTDTWWVEAAVPVDELRWIQVPQAPGEAGSTVRVFHEAAWGKGVSRPGRVLRLAAELESRGRMARVLVAVDDPLAAPALLLGAWVRLEIDGQTLPSVVALERKLVRDGEQVWLMNADNRLEIKPLDIIWRGRDRVLVQAGLLAGDRVVSSDLAMPVPGMALQLLTARDSEKRPAVAP